ncbi:unnamed protein product, partial [marine sediment metagenome]
MVHNLQEVLLSEPGQTDNKVEIRHDGLNYDLAGYNYLL